MSRSHKQGLIWKQIYDRDLNILIRTHDQKCLYYNDHISPEIIDSTPRLQRALRVLQNIAEPAMWTSASIQPPTQAQPLGLDIPKQSTEPSTGPPPATSLVTSSIHQHVIAPFGSNTSTKPGELAAIPEAETDDEGMS